MKKYIVLSIILTFFCFILVGNLSGLTKPITDKIDKKIICELGIHSKQFILKHDTDRPDTNIFIHSKTDEYELWLYKNNEYKAIYNDGKYIVGTWKFVFSNSVTIMFFKDRLRSTSEKDFQFHVLEFRNLLPEFNKDTLLYRKEKNPDPYPLLWDGNK